MEQDSIIEKIQPFIFAAQFCQFLVNRTFQTINRKVSLAQFQQNLFQYLPIHAINKMHTIQQCLIGISKQQYCDKQNKQLFIQKNQVYKQIDQEPKKNVQQHWLVNQVRISNPNKDINNSIQIRPNTGHPTKNSDKKLQKFHNNQSILSSYKLQYSKKKNNSQNKIVSNKDYSKYAAVVDLGFTFSSDPFQQLLRKRKQDQLAKKIQREEADRKNILNKKKQDRQMIQTLMKDSKKQKITFTYDYDGNLLPVNKVENLKFFTGQTQMSYHVDNNSVFGGIVGRTQSSIHNRNNPKQAATSNTNKTFLVNHLADNLQQQNNKSISYFYRNFQMMQMSNGTLLKSQNGKTVLSQQNGQVPNLDFLISKPKQGQIKRIQQRHYLQFIKHGNLKRIIDQQNNKNNKFSDSSSSNNVNDQFDEFQLNGKKNRNTIQQQNIKVANFQLLKELKNGRQVNQKTYILQPRKMDQPIQDFSQLDYNPIDQFNRSKMIQNNNSLLMSCTDGKSFKSTQYTRFRESLQSSDMKKLRVRKQ